MKKLKYIHAMCPFSLERTQNQIIIKMISEFASNSIFVEVRLCRYILRRCKSFIKQKYQTLLDVLLLYMLNFISNSIIFRLRF